MSLVQKEIHGIDKKKRISSQTSAIEDIMPADQFRISKKLGFFLGPLVFFVLVMSEAPWGLEQNAWYVMCVAVFMAIWWISEALPLTATAFLPLVLFPLLGVMDLDTASKPYTSPIIFLFLGGFMVALAMQKWKLHLRIALNVVKKVGTKPSHMVLGFMISSAFLSMWISNTATIMMMLPLTLAVVQLLNENKHYDKIDPQLKKNFAIAIMLGICYSVSIGGMGTVIGTPPNAFFKGYMQSSYGYDISFIEWMYIGVPFTIVMIATCWFVLVKWLFPIDKLVFKDADKVIQAELDEIGEMKRGEILTAFVCMLTACGWIFQDFFRGFIPNISDAWVAMFSCILLFMIPVHFGKGIFLMRWEDAKKLPWGVLFLFGGGLSLASGFKYVDLDSWIGLQMGGVGELSLIAMILIVLATVLLLTEVMSNIATTTILLPVFSAMAVGLGENPLLLLIPATMAASCGFMMPVATAANAIIFGTGYVQMRQMVTAGFILNVVSIFIILAIVYFLAIPVFGIETGVVPDWVHQDITKAVN